jgi:tape measure domain-containing protein
MATISELNVRLGLITRDFDRQLRAVESRLRSSGQAMADLGQRISLSITAPLAGIGAAAIKSAGDMESLRLAMESTFASAGRSVAEAHAELEALRKAALAPGLDFEQAVKASIRLQSVGYSAEAARKVISELANTIAMTGGTAENLDSVTVQMTQMIGKGKVLSQDLRIMVENMPKLADLMLKTFGTTNTEAIQKMGISGKDFVDRITEAASVLPRVQGGIKNAFVNAAAAAQQSLATLGETLVKTFNITGRLDAVSNALTDLVEGFKGLTAGEQAFIGWSAAIVAAIGPLLWSIGQLKLIGVSVISFYLKSFLPALGSLKVFALEAAVAFEALGAAQKLLIAVAVAYAITKIVEAVIEWNTALTETQKLQKSISDVQQQAQKSIAKEKAEISLLTKTLENNNASMASREAALKRLQQISPEYFGNLKIEKGLVAGLDAAVKGYVGSITRAATAQAAFAKIQTLANEKIDQENELKKEASLLTKAEAIIAGAVSPGADKTILANRHAGTLQRIKDIEAEQKALEKLIEENGGLNKALDENSAATGKNTILTQEQIDAKEEAAKAQKSMATALKDVEKGIDAINKKQAELGSDFVGEKTKEIEAGVERLIDAGFSPSSAPVQKLKGYLQQIRAQISAGFGAPNATQTAVGASPAAAPQVATLPLPGSIGAPDTGAAEAAMQKQLALTESVKRTYVDLGLTASQVMQSLNAGVISFSEAWGQMSTVVMQTGDAMQTVALALGQGLVDAFNAGTSGAKSFAQEFVQSAAKIIKAAIQMAVTQAALKMLESVPPPYNIIAAGIAGAAAGALFQALVNKVTAPALAGGGVIRQPTMALVGEYAGARHNPEIVTPEKLMRSVFRDESANMGGMVEVYGTIRGSDILLSSEKATRERGRYR